jgi:hypothetical protein
MSGVKSKGRYGWYILGLLAAALLLVALYYAGRAALADLSTMRARAAVLQLKREGRIPTPQESRDYLAALEDALATAPDNGQLHEDIGYLYAVRGTAALRFPEIARGLLEKALFHYQLAARYRPMDSHAWASIALCKHFLDQGDATLWGAYDKAMLYGANEPETQFGLFLVGLKRWPELGPARQQALQASYQRARPHLKDRLAPLVAQSKLPGFAAGGAQNKG